MNKAILASLLVAVSLRASAEWVIGIDEARASCGATYWTGSGLEVGLYANEQTRELRSEAGRDETYMRSPIIEWRNILAWRLPLELGLPPLHQIEDEEIRPWKRVGDGLIEVRVFPDDGEEQRGFMTPGHLEVRARRDRVVYADLRWVDFDHHSRLRRWGTAKETKEDDGIRLPEVRLILKWRSEDKDVYLDVPLWRTSNVMNKFDVCTEV